MIAEIHFAYANDGLKGQKGIVEHIVLKAGRFGAHQEGGEADLCLPVSCSVCGSRETKEYGINMTIVHKEGCQIGRKEEKKG